MEQPPRQGAGCASLPAGSPQLPPPAVTRLRQPIASACGGLARASHQLRPQTADPASQNPSPAPIGVPSVPIEKTKRNKNTGPEKWRDLQLSRPVPVQAQNAHQQPLNFPVQRQGQQVSNDLPGDTKAAPQPHLIASCADFARQSLPFPGKRILLE